MGVSQKSKSAKIYEYVLFIKNKNAINLKIEHSINNKLLYGGNIFSLKENDKIVGSD